MREIVAGLSRYDGILNVGDDSEQLLWPDAATLSALITDNRRALSRRGPYGW